MVPIATERMPLEPKKTAATRLDEGARVRRAGRPHVTAGPTSRAGKLVLRHVTSAASVIYEEGREKQNSWGGDSWGNCFPTRSGRQAGTEEEIGWWGWVEGEEDGMMKKGGRERERALAAA